MHQKQQILLKMCLQTRQELSPAMEGQRQRWGGRRVQMRHVFPWMGPWGIFHADCGAHSVLTPRPWESVPAAACEAEISQRPNPPRSTHLNAHSFWSSLRACFKHLFKLYICLTDVRKCFGYTALNSQSLLGETTRAMSSSDVAGAHSGVGIQPQSGKVQRGLTLKSPAPSPPASLLWSPCFSTDAAWHLT